MNLTVINALLDDLGQSGFQLTDQMFEILMVEKWQKPYVRSSFRRQRNLETEMQFVIKPEKKEIASKSYAELKRDSERFSCVLEKLGEQGNHVAITGMTSYTWLTAYLGTVNSASVAVPLDVSLPAEEMCELIHRADAMVFVVDEIRRDVAAIVKERCPKLKYLISMQKEESDEEALFSGNWWKKQRISVRSFLLRRICAPSCLLPEQQEKARGLCLPTGIWQKMQPALI